MRITILEVLKSDINNYRRLTSSSFWKEPLAILIVLFRIVKSVDRISFKPLRWLFNLFLIPLYRFSSIFFGISLPLRTRIASGFVIFHYGAIAINSNAIIGYNCVIRRSYHWK